MGHTQKLWEVMQMDVVMTELRLLKVPVFKSLLSV